MPLNHYVTLGRSGLRVSPLCLGTMTFGTDWGWGAGEETSRALFNRYIDAGGNFVDTADLYVNGKSEEMLGRFVAERSLRDRMVLATKFTFNGEQGNPNAGGNGRKNIYRALEGSLRRLGTDYIDLYWLHAWDGVTPAEEVVGTLDALVQAGKIRYYGFSNVPGWYIGRSQTLAEKEGKECAIALQLEYSLVERNIELEQLPAAREFHMGITPWSPLASGFLTGKYRREQARGEGRLSNASDNPTTQKLFTDRNWSVLDVLLDVSKEVGRSPAEVALNWVATQPGITSTIIGATKLEQLETNLRAIDFELPQPLRKRLDEAGEPEKRHPYMFYGGFFQNLINGGVPVRRPDHS
jgi:aryl-alcohol dehydrogenase-like predicted oxidoreductase